MYPKRLRPHTQLFAILALSGLLNACCHCPKPASHPNVSKTDSSKLNQKHKHKESKEKTPLATAIKHKPVAFEIYAMSKCPYFAQAMLQIEPALKQLQTGYSFSVDYIVTPKGDTFESLHGSDEVKGDLIQICAAQQLSDPVAQAAFINCMSQNFPAVLEDWQSCAKAARIDEKAIIECAEGPVGKKLLRKSSARAKAKNATGSPTIYIGGSRHNVGRDAIDFVRAVCINAADPQPAACANLPKPVDVKAIVVTDKRCKKCETSRLERDLRNRFFPNLTVRIVDYSSAEGKQLYKEFKLEKLPVWLFEPSVSRAWKYKMIAQWLDVNGRYRQLRIPGEFDPTAEICDNNIDDTQNGLTDCNDPTCKETLLCRPAKKHHLQVFVMSQCPYAARGTLAMKEVLKNFRGKLTFDMHYIADKRDDTDTGFSALHGQSEVRENIRQLCAKKLYGQNNKWLDYVWCRAEDFSSNNWKSCAKHGISVKKIERCASSAEGKQLLRDDIQIAKVLQIRASPTWIVNNRYKANGISAEQIKNHVCRQNADLPNCDKQLDNSQAATGSCN